MSDGLTLYCPSCGKMTALNKEYDEIKMKLRNSESEEWYDSCMPVYTCKSCGLPWAIERVVKQEKKFVEHALSETKQEGGAK